MKDSGILVMADVEKISPHLRETIYRRSQPRKEWGLGGSPLPHTAAVYIDPNSLDGNILAVARMEQDSLSIELPRESVEGHEITDDEVRDFIGALGMTSDKIIPMEVGKTSRHNVASVVYVRPVEPLAIKQPRPNPATQGLFVLIPVAYWEKLLKTPLVDAGSMDAARQGKMLAAIYGKEAN